MLDAERQKRQKVERSTDYLQTTVCTHSAPVDTAIGDPHLAMPRGYKSCLPSIPKHVTWSIRNRGTVNHSDVDRQLGAHE